MQKGQLVSVIIPAYNAAAYLAESIRSVLDQSYGMVECIVVDDGSTDDTRKIACSFGKNVLYIYQENAERSAARNNGLLHARGDLISFLDADDYLAPQKIEDQLLFLQEQPEYDAVYSKVKFFQDGPVRSFSSPNRKTPSGDITEELLYGNFIAMHSPLIRKVAIDRAGGFDPALSHNEDWEFMLRLAISGTRFAFLDVFHAFCRLHGQNTSRDVVRMHETKWLVAEKFVKSHAQVLRERGIDCSKVLSYHKADYGKALILNGAVREGRRLIAEAGRDLPNRRILLLFSFCAGILGSKALRTLDAATHGLRKWKKAPTTGE